MRGKMIKKIIIGTVLVSLFTGFANAKEKRYEVDQGYDRLIELNERILEQVEDIREAERRREKRYLKALRASWVSNRYFEKETFQKMHIQLSDLIYKHFAEYKVRNMSDEEFRQFTFNYARLLILGWEDLLPKNAYYIDEYNIQDDNTSAYIDSEMVIQYNYFIEKGSESAGKRFGYCYPQTITIQAFNKSLAYGANFCTSGKGYDSMLTVYEVRKGDTVIDKHKDSTIEALFNIY